MPKIKLSEQVGRVHIARARYDAAQTTDENRRHWSAADGLSADAANNPGVRAILRNRARYVYANNPRARGIIRTLANHTVGTGPRLQMLLGDNKAARRLAERIEAAFMAWAKEVKLAKKLRAMRIAKVVSGEVFAIKTINPALRHPVKLDIQLVEADQVCNPYGNFSDPMDVDGIRFDEYGNRVSYRILKVHPGDALMTGMGEAYDDIPAAFVTHYFVEDDRPGVHRSVPEITPAVQVFEEGRRFRAAVLAAAETAADFAMAIQSDAPPDGDAAEIEPMDEFELKRRMATVLPQGWKLTQTKAEQPTTTFKEFSRELLSEVARCIQMPLTIAALDSSESNMSAAYIDHQTYASAIRVERSDIDLILDDWLDAWLTMAMDPMLGIMGRRTPSEFPHTWFWPSIGQHADPAKVANAQVAKLEKNLTTLSDEYAKEGMDWEAALRQRSREKTLMKQLGLTEDEAAPAANRPQQHEDTEDDE